VSNSDPAEELRIVGTHEFRFIPPRRVLFVMRGVFEEEHALAYTEFLAKHAERCGEPLEGLLDLSALSSITPSARTRIVKRDRTVAYCRIAIVGASFSIRTVSSMMINAGKIVTPSRFAFDTKFFGTVEEAIAWFETSRREKNTP
jgi:hypothetical protein